MVRLLLMMMMEAQLAQIDARYRNTLGSSRPPSADTRLNIEQGISATSRGEPMLGANPVAEPELSTRAVLGKGVTPEEKAMFESLEKTISETTLPSLSEAAEESQKLLDAAFAGVGACNREFAAEKVKATAAKGEALAANSAHEKLLEDIAATDEKVITLSDTLAGWMSANAAPDGVLKSKPASAELAVTARAYSEWGHGYVSRWDPLAAQKLVLQNLKEDKEKSEAARTEKYCSWRQIKDLTINSYEVCWTTATSAFAAALSEEESNSKARESTFQVVHKLQCLLQVLKSPTDQHQAKHAECEAQSVDASGVGIKKPTLPQKESIEVVQSFGIDVRIACSAAEAWDILPPLDGAEPKTVSLQFPFYMGDVANTPGVSVEKVSESKAVACVREGRWGTPYYCMVLLFTGSGLVAGPQHPVKDFKPIEASVMRLSENKVLFCGRLTHVQCQAFLVEGTSVEKYGGIIEIPHGSSHIALMTTGPGEGVEKHDIADDGKVLLCQNEDYGWAKNAHITCAVATDIGSSISVGSLVTIKEGLSHAYAYAAMAAVGPDRVFVCHDDHAKHYCGIMQVKGTTVEGPSVWLQAPITGYEPAVEILNSQMAMLCVSGLHTCSLFSISGTSVASIEDSVTMAPVTKGENKGPRMARLWADAVSYCWTEFEREARTPWCSVATMKDQKIHWGTKERLALGWSNRVGMTDLGPGKVLACYSDWGDRDGDFVKWPEARTRYWSIASNAWPPTLGANPVAEPELSTRAVLGF
eukprot:s793_g3.t2